MLPNACHHPERRNVPERGSEPINLHRTQKHPGEGRVPEMRGSFFPGITSRSYWPRRRCYKGQLRYHLIFALAHVIVIAEMERSRETPRPASPRRGIQSVETGLRVLTALAASTGPSTLTSIGARSGLAPSQTHRYLQSLVASGMAVQNSSSRYDLGPGVIRIGIAALARLNTFARAEAALGRFVEDTGRTVMLSVWGEAGAVCVRWLPGHPPVVTSLGVGSVMPLLFSATGRVFLSYLSPQELAGPLSAAMAERVVLPDIDAVRGAVRATMTAFIDQQVFPGLRAVAVPIFDLQGRASMVATAIASPSAPLEHDAAVAQRLLAACRTATEEAGGTWPT
jgi:DNA-binding IclR family transcriptional regulator